LSKREALQDELGRLCTLQNKFIDDEEYEKAEIMKTKINNIQNKIDKL
jgi:protein-arginine kinase activator protein McsA